MDYDPEVLIAGILGGVPRYFHLERFPGRWVAIDMATDDVVLTAATPQQLEADIRASGLRNVMVMRAPTEDEPLFVGPSRRLGDEQRCQ